MSSEEFFTEEFQKMVLVAVLRDKENQSLYLNLLESKMFSADKAQRLFKVIKNYFTVYGTPPSFPTLRELAKQKKAVDILDYMAEIENIPISEDFTRDTIIKYTTHRKLVSTTKKLITKLKAGKYNEYADIARKVVGFTEHTSSGIFLKRDVEKRDKARKDNVFLPPKIPTGYEVLDYDYLYGGLSRGEMVVVTAPTNYGKSMFLCNLGKGAMEAGHKVVHFTLEMADTLVANRYDAIISGIKKRELKEHDVSAQFLRMVESWASLDGEVIIKQFPTYGVKVAELEAYLDILESLEGYTPDVIIVDYGELMTPPSLTVSEYKQLGDIYGGLRAIATKRNTVMITASQAVRSARYKEVVGVEHTGKSIMIAQHTDIQFTLMATQNEMDNGIMRLGIPKNREDKKAQSKGLLLRVDWDIQRVNNIEKVESYEKTMNSTYKPQSDKGGVEPEKDPFDDGFGF